VIYFNQLDEGFARLLGLQSMAELEDGSLSIQFHNRVERYVPSTVTEAEATRYNLDTIRFKGRIYIRAGEES